jgi:raw score 8.31
LILHSVKKWKLSYNSLLILFFMAASLAVWAMFI